MKKWLSLALALVLALCLYTSGSAEWQFERKVNIVCPWGEGGGADSTLRPMARLLADILGVPVEIINVDGVGGVNGVEYTYNQPADGYTFMLGTQSLFMQDMQGMMSMDFKTEFKPVDMLVHAINIIAASRKSMGNYGVANWQELCEYIEENPNTVSVGMLTTTGVDGVSLAQAIAGLRVQEDAYTSGTSVKDALVRGQCDLAVCGADEIADLIDSGDVIPMLALCETRMQAFPDIPCSSEWDIDANMGPWRAIFCRRDTPEEAVMALINAIEQARQSETWQAFLRSAAYDERAIVPAGEALEAFVESEYKELSDYLKAQGVLLKNYYAK